MSETSGELKDFVRHGLGCACPDPVLARIRLETVPMPDRAWRRAWRLQVGDRLLILVVVPPNWEALVESLPGLLLSGRDERDAQGYNRFRLVVATAAASTAGPVLHERMRGLELDERVHLHVVDPKALPDSLR
jgi:hypothetical protein